MTAYVYIVVCFPNNGWEQESLSHHLSADGACKWITENYPDAIAEEASWKEDDVKVFYRDPGKDGDCYFIVKEDLKP